MRAGETGRVVLTAPGVGLGTTLRVAVRPERVRIAEAGAPVEDGGSRLEGTVAQVVYLGMYTQFHVKTPAGVVVASRLADELASPFDVGREVSVSWEAEHTSVLSDAMPELVSL